jgi:hypothetical protein
MRDFDRDTFIAQIEARRARRMAASVTFFEGKNAKLKHISAVAKHKIDKLLEGIERDLGQLDKILERVEGRAEKVDQLRNEIELATAAMVEIDDGD